MRTLMVKAESARAEEDSVWGLAAISVNQVAKVRQAQLWDLWGLLQKLALKIVQYQRNNECQKREWNSRIDLS